MSRSCSTFENYCGCNTHDDATRCHSVMNMYYMYKHNGKVFYICPTCETSEAVSYEIFFKAHSRHLDQFKKSKRIVFNSRMNIPERTIVSDRTNVPEATIVPDRVIPQELPQKISKPIVYEISDDEEIKAEPIIIELSDNDEVVQPVSRKRKIVAEQSQAPRKIKKLNKTPNQFCPTVEVESDFRGSHVIVKSDISGLNTKELIVPDCMMDKMHEITSAMKSSKIQFGVFIEFAKDDAIKMDYLSNKAIPFSPEFINDGYEKLKEKMDVFIEKGSGWIINRIAEVVFVITKTMDIIRLSGSSFIPTPESLLSSHAVINVQNKDELCFLYSILAVKKYDSIPKPKNRVESYTKYLSELEYKDLSFPMKIYDIPKFERLNPHIAINVLQYDDTVDINMSESIFKHPYINLIYRSKRFDITPITLLLLQDANTWHYVGVRNINKLLNLQITHLSLTRIQCKWCPRCFHGFRKEPAFEKHVALCEKNMDGTTLFVMPKEKFVEFKDFHKTIPPPYVIYADFEAVLKPDEKFHQKHVPIAAGLLFLNTSDSNDRKYFHFVGDDCIPKFLECIDSLAKNVVLPYFRQNYNKKMNALTDSENISFQRQTSCYLCKKINSYLVKDHDHFSGQYLGAACNKCNLSRRLPKSVNLPIVFHNLKGYDMHHILKYGCLYSSKWTFSCIPTTTEKFLALMVHQDGIVLRFIDSLQFLISSLATLANNLTVKPFTSIEFDSSMVQSKGIFPYNYATSLDILEQTKEMIPIWEGISEAEYESAKQMWAANHCQNLKDYMLAYLKLDVFLLADVFEAFRKESHTDDGLEPLNYFSIPGISWASALKTLKHPVELLQDPEMYKFFEVGIRGGMTFVNKHHAKADEDTSLLYIDINNLYGWALRRKLPYGNFEWIEDGYEEIIDQCIALDLGELDYGYQLEVDLVIPASLHDMLDDLPIAPVKECPPGSKVEKLMLTHNNKYNYVLNWQLLQLYLQLGVVLKKVHRAVRYSQAEIFRDYIDSNTAKRAAAINEFEKDYFKLKNNSLYGKTVENLRKRMCLRLCTTEKSLVTYTSSAFFNRTIKIEKDFVAVMLQKEVITLARPSYIGQAVLDLSKLLMYRCWYILLQKYIIEFGCSIRIIAGDTDSFFLEIKGVDLEKQLKPAMIRDGILDTSNYDVNHPLYTKANNQIGKFKDESKGESGYEDWYFLRPKCYVLKKKDGKCSKRAKGISLGQTSIDFESYKDAYENGTIVSVEQRKFVSRQHQLYTSTFSKVALSSADDKRCWVEKNKSYAYGHYQCVDVEEEEEEEDEDEEELDEWEDNDWMAEDF